MYDKKNSYKTWCGNVNDMYNYDKYGHDYPFKYHLNETLWRGSLDSTSCVTISICCETMNETQSLNDEWNNFLRVGFGLSRSMLLVRHLQARQKIWKRWYYFAHVVWDLILVGEENKTLRIRVWKPFFSRHVLKSWGWWWYVTG